MYVCVCDWKSVIQTLNQGVYVIPVVCNIQQTFLQRNEPELYVLHCDVEGHTLWYTYFIELPVCCWLERHNPVFHLLSGVCTEHQVPEGGYHLETRKFPHQFMLQTYRWHSTLTTKSPNMEVTMWSTIFSGQDISTVMDFWWCTSFNYTSGADMFYYFLDKIPASMHNVDLIFSTASILHVIFI